MCSLLLICIQTFYFGETFFVYFLCILQFWKYPILEMCSIRHTANKDMYVLYNIPVTGIIENVSSEPNKMSHENETPYSYYIYFEKFSLLIHYYLFFVVEFYITLSTCHRNKNQKWGKVSGFKQEYTVIMMTTKKKNAAAARAGEKHHISPFKYPLFYSCKQQKNEWWLFWVCLRCQRPTKSLCFEQQPNIL